MPALNERAPHVVELRFRVGRALVRVVGVFLAVEVARAVAARRWRLVRAVPGAEALQARPCLDQRAIDREVIVRQEALDLGVAQHGLEELRGHVGVEQPVAVLEECRVADEIIDAEPCEPMEQRVVVDLLHRLTLQRTE